MLMGQVTHSEAEEWIQNTEKCNERRQGNTKEDDDICFTVFH